MTPDIGGSKPLNFWSLSLPPSPQTASSHARVRMMMSFMAKTSDHGNDFHRTVDYFVPRRHPPTVTTRLRDLAARNR